MVPSYLQKIKDKVFGLRKSPEPIVKKQPVVESVAEVLQQVVAGEEIQTSVFGCDHCGATITTNGTRYQCTECCNENTFDLCSDCYEKEQIYYTGDRQSLGDDYTPPKHSDSAPLPHFCTPEVYSQYELVNKLSGNNSLETMRKTFEYFKNRRCLGFRKKVEQSEYPSGLGDFEWLTFEQVYEKSQLLANAITHYIQPRELIGISANNCIEWYLSDFASLWDGLIIVPIHHTYNTNSLFEVIDNSEISCIVVSSETFKVVAPILIEKRYTKLKLLIHIEDTVDQEILEQIPKDVVVKTFKEMYEIGSTSEPKYVWKGNDGEDIFDILYSSGSTGTPKGIVTTDKIWNKLLREFVIEYPSVSCSFATLAHSQRLTDWRYISQGSRVGIYSGSMEYLFEDLQLLRPKSIGGVPRFWNYIYSLYKSDRDTVLGMIENPTQDDIDNCEAILTKKYSTFLGDRIKTIVTGGAPTSPDVLDWMARCWDHARISNSYGLSEVVGVSSNGYISSSVQFRLDPVPDFGYFPSDEPYPRGELVVKSATMSTYYYKNEQLTKDSFEDGWFKTGDIVELRGARYIKIIDRKKHAFKLSNGEFVAPEPLENMFLKSGSIENIFIYGNPYQTFLVAIVIPSAQFFELNEITSTMSVEELNNNSQLKTQLLKEINRIAKEKNLPNYEIPKIISIDSTKWTVDNNLITGSQKYRRAQLYSFYKLQIEKMYGNLEDLQKTINNSASKGDIIEKYVKAVLGLDTGDSNDSIGDLSFSDIGGDSLGAIKLSAMLKEKANIDISPKLLLNKDVSISSIIKGNVKIKKINWIEEMKLDPTLVPVSSTKVKSKKELKIFLTGCTGYLGSFLLGKLVMDSNQVEKVYCLVRGKGSKQEALELIKGKFEKLEIPVPKNFEKIVEPIIGDLSIPNFGLTDSEFDSLANSIDLIIHNGAVVNMVLPYPNMKPSNVQATIDIIRLSMTGKYLKKLVYISTMGIFTNRYLSISEDITPTTDNLEYMNGYNQSKLISDILVREASTRGIPTMIFRPGTIYSHTESGVDNPIDFIGLITKSILYTKKYPDNNQYELNLAPVDWVSDSISKLIFQDNIWQDCIQLKKTSIYHMVNPKPIQLDSYASMISSTYPLEKVDSQEWTSLAKDPNHPLYSFHNYFNRVLPVNKDKDMHGYICKKTSTDIESIKGGYACPEITQPLVTNNVQYLIKTYLSSIEKQQQ
eukprot:gene5512-6866_t